MAQVTMHFAQNTLASNNVGGYAITWLPTDGHIASGCWNVSGAALVMACTASIDWIMQNFDLAAVPSVATLTWSYRYVSLVNGSPAVSVGIILQKPDTTVVSLSGAVTSVSSATWVETSNVNVAAAITVSGTYGIGIRFQHPTASGARAVMRFDRIRMYFE